MWLERKSNSEGVDFRAMEKFLGELRKFIKNQLIEGVDYGYIYSSSGERLSDKPLLFKSGAEKLARLFNLTVEYRVEKNEDWDRGFFVYMVEARAYRNGNYIASGFGIATSREKKFRNWEANDLPNALIKLAKKRAFVDVVLTATAASSFFLVSSVYSDEPISESQRKYMRKLAKDKGLDWDFVKENIIKPLTGKTSSKELTREEASRVIDALLRWEERE